MCILAGWRLVASRMSRISRLHIYLGTRRSYMYVLGKGRTTCVYW